jgi:amino acid transporter
MVDPNALVEAGFETDGAPDPTTVLFITGAERLGEIWGTAAALLFATSLFAALLSFHNAVARYAFALGREGVLPSVFGRVNSRTGAPWVASLTQSVLALTIVLVFAIAAANPVLTLFTWLTNLGALGVLLLMAATSFAVGLTEAPIDTMTVVLPLILFGGGIVGLIVGAVLKRSRPDVYERIGGGAGAEE